jgi:mannose-6-phosphate isomerase-like protein (cupin superfamily)
MGTKKENKARKYKIGKVKKITAPSFVMNPAELHQYLPKNSKFNIKRVYWLTEPSGEKKSGQHAHTDEDEIFIVIKGSAEIILDDDGKGRENIKLVENDLVWVPRFVWHGYESFSPDCIILALTSTNYDPERKGYIEDYKEFKKFISSK